MDFPVLLKHPTFGDHRGNFCQMPINMMDNKSVDKNWVQVNTSISVEPYTLRGMHFQVGNFQQSKYMKIVWGKILNFIICVDPSRPDYGQEHIFEIDKDHAVFVPRGYANGILTLEPNTIIQYLVDNSYSPQNERSLLYSSVPLYKELIGRYTLDPIISDKDKNGILWEDWKSNPQL
jgi:dTDP-4-dehydrorhamnose 3,5-epimerase